MKHHVKNPLRNILAAVVTTPLFLLPSARAANPPDKGLSPTQLQVLAASPRDASFQVYPHEIASVTFAAGQPGPVHITARWKGAPLTLALHSRTRKLAEAKGETEAAIQYSLTDADLKEGSLWTVSLLATSPPRPSLPRRDKEAKPLAEGTVHIEHPVAETGQLEGDLRRLLQNSGRHAAAAVQSAPWASLRQAAYLKERAAAHAAMLESAQAEFASGSSPSGGDNGTRQIFTLTPDPTIVSLSHSEGDPGTPVLISGSGFGSQPGEVHFVVAPGNDQTAPLETNLWSDTQAVAYVPSVEGVPAFDGFVYVKTAGGLQSDVKPFHFNPALDRVDLDIYADTPDHEAISQDFWRANDPEVHTGWNTGIYVIQSEPGAFGLVQGRRGDDEYYAATHLLNGWVVDQVHFQDRSDSNGAAASVKESYENTDSPHVRVHWWCNALNEATYLLSITIRGPKGTPYR